MVSRWFVVSFWASMWLQKVFMIDSGCGKYGAFTDVNTFMRFESMAKPCPSTSSTPHINKPPIPCISHFPPQKKKNDGLVGIKFKNSVTAQEEELILRRYLDDESIQDGRFPRSVTINDTKTVPKKNIMNELYIEWNPSWKRFILSVCVCMEIMDLLSGQLLISSWWFRNPKQPPEMYKTTSK